MLAHVGFGLEKVLLNMVFKCKYPGGSMFLLILFCFFWCWFEHGGWNKILEANQQKLSEAVARAEESQVQWGGTRTYFQQHLTWPFRTSNKSCESCVWINEWIKRDWFGIWLEPIVSKYTTKYWNKDQLRRCRQNWCICWYVLLFVMFGYHNYDLIVRWWEINQQTK